ncbi:MAG: HNH endonuclease [Solirubrobacteraceae bacterium]
MGSRRFGGSARVALFLAARGRCAACGAALEPGWHADHVVPVSGGGATAPANGQALCPRCNQRKGAGDTAPQRVDEAVE